MAGTGRSLAGKALIAAVVAAIGLLASPLASEAAAGNTIDIGIQVGYNGAVKLGQWMPVTVDLTNHGPQVDGTLEIDTANTAASKGGPPAGSAIYQTAITLASGATKHLRTYLSEDFPGNVEVRVVQNGRVLQSAQLSIATSVSGLLVGVLSDVPTALDEIATIHPSGNAPTVVHLAGPDVPDSPLVLRAFDLIALDDFSTDTLTSAQRTAVADYVVQGGSLLLSSGGSWHKTLASLPNTLVPMQVSSSIVLPRSEALGGVANVEITTGSLSPGANVLLGERGLPLLVESPVGAGWVTMSTFDWAQGPIAASSDDSALLRQQVVRVTYGSANGAGALVTAGKGGTIGNSVAMRGGGLAQALGNVPPLDLPAWWLIGALVVVYVLVIGPVNYFVLRGVGHRALAWITVPAIAIVASGGAYGASLLTKGTSVVVNEVAIVHVQPGWARAYSEQYTGIVTPTRGDFEVGLDSRPSMISPIDYFYNPNNANLATMRVNTANDAITLPSMTAFSLRGFATENITSSPNISGTVQIVGGQVKGTITNESSLTFTDGVVMSGGAYQKIGRLAPGGSTTFNFAFQSVTSPGPPVSATIYPNSLCCSGAPPGVDASVERKNEIRSTILGTLSGANYGGLGAPVAPIVVLWTDEPFQHVHVNGATPRAYVESAIAMSLPLAQFGAGTVPAGLVNGRLVDIDADLTPAGPPGLVVASSGSVVYSFQPALTAGSRLTAASVTSINPYGAKFATGPNGPGVVKGQAWDWTSSSWIDVTYMEGGTTAIPDSAVNPATGEVRLKLGSDGQFSAGFLSLTGTVK
ncbi:MAG TPA: hypothetical protein VKE27_02000 [Candidatus Dormibacteraeota bacterium]|nr:hypothetical protein [Candidatus Dormibacteraeota bacterium]